jgi:hypothetical protein
VSGVIAVGAMVVDAVYFNMVEHAPYWYTQLDLKTVVKVRHVLQSGLQLDEDVEEGRKNCDAGA